ncbi:hypothetical protein CNMCM8980_001903 [Aspergillus fumigatiaffinis]|jgi:hypothetical protein|uniref:Uncharacterized protein n=1 Tax=Aspergillus fumigatiaffinis TaxID=340414 RepID=A0A8H4MDL7_9EURO|nr:hypothetical protein CNMCM5878_002852 [Aspergillus fumigatiaffinis]KAF4241340.1 hypothetical protein CNMCM6457_006443 [Aspergillus fumigatiaffinis]KAF4242816.1 hypothetical protein CNMCM6805_002440 [Aspergillus fumigatiaffinis]KAF4250044.1 hypothetical protein CNMCM8980_001903 [Aspergillus fumigatiaffinis]
MPLASKNEKTEIESTLYHNEKADRAQSCNSYNPCTTISAYHPKKGYPKYHGLIRQNLGPFMILPVTGSAQAEAMWFFEYISIKHLNEYRPCESWRQTLMFFSQTVPSVRYAAIALALIHRSYLYRDSSDRMHQPQSSRDWLRDNAPLFHYNRAIRFLLDQESGNSTERIAITLLVCYLFTCFDHLAGNYVQAVKHLRGGVELSRNIDKAILYNNSTYDDSEPSGVRTLIYQVTRQIRRLDMQAVSFLVDWTPVDIQETFVSQLPPDGTFPSLDLAADHLQAVVAQVMRLRHTVQQMSPMDRMPPTLLSLKDIVLGQLETWLRSFKNTLRQDRSYKTDSESYPIVSLLRLQHTVARILLSCCGPGREMDYDNFLPQFQQCVALARNLAAAHERYSEPLRPTFTPEIGIIPLLYIIGVKCRHPMVRREVLSILRGRPTQEAVWDSISAARVIERVIEIEEGGLEEGQMIQSMEQIAVCQRIEVMSWIHVPSGQSAVRLDISYTFCAREGLHTESLLI